MPELPEVETTVRLLKEPLVGCTVKDVWNDWPRHIAVPDLSQLRERIVNKKIISAGRRGKYIVLRLEAGEFLLIHLKMTGHLSVSTNSEEDPHVHTIFFLDNGSQLRFKDVRKFGRVYLVKDADEILGALGPEPLAQEFSGEKLRGMLRGRNRMLKPLLLDQTFLAGLGNIYTDEALYDAAIHPGRSAASLSKRESKALFDSITYILKAAIAQNGSSVENYRKPDGTQGSMQNSLKVYGKQGFTCSRCGGIIERVVLGGRGTHLCAGCQK